jgi:hypothetical protein
LSLYKNNINRNKSNSLLHEKKQQLIIARESEKTSQARADFFINRQ